MNEDEEAGLQEFIFMQHWAIQSRKSTDNNNQ